MAVAAAAPPRPPLVGQYRGFLAPPQFSYKSLVAISTGRRTNHRNPFPGLHTTMNPPAPKQRHYSLHSLFGRQGYYNDHGNGYYGYDNLSGGAIAGIVIGSILGFLVLLWLVYCCWAMGRGSSRSSHHHHHRRSRRSHRSRSCSTASCGRSTHVRAYHVETGHIPQPAPTACQGGHECKHYYN